MLILTRRIGESLYIGDNIKITVTRVDGGKVSIGIAAPRDIPVNRQEVHERIKKQEKKS